MKASSNGNGSKPKFVQVPISVQEDRELSDREVRVYGAVRSFAWKLKGQPRNPCKASLEQIAERSAGKTTQTREALHSLVAKGWLTAASVLKARGATPTIYRVVEISYRNNCLGSGFPDPTPPESRTPTPPESRTLSRRSQVDESEVTPLTPSKAGGANQKTGGLNPRANGTNPRAIADAWDEALNEKRRRFEARMEAIDPYPDRRDGFAPFARGRMENLIRRSMAGKPIKWRPSTDYVSSDQWEWIQNRVKEIGAEGLEVSPEEFAALLTGKPLAHPNKSVG